MPLGICANCKRHARCDDVCPFCGGAQIACAPRARSNVLRVAAIVAGLGAGCANSEYGGPPPPPEWSDFGVDPNAADGGSDARDASDSADE